MNSRQRGKRSLKVIVVREFAAAAARSDPDGLRQGGRDHRGSWQHALSRPETKVGYRGSFSNKDSSSEVFPGPARATG